MQSSERQAFLTELHRSIHDSADSALAAFDNRGIEPVYPPGVELTSAEILALGKLQLSEEMRSALRKLFVDAAARPLFQLFSLVDGVADPSNWPSEPWLGLTLSEKDEDSDNAEMWHDEFFESYWAYRDTSDG